MGNHAGNAAYQPQAEVGAWQQQKNKQEATMISAQEAREMTVSLCKEARRNLEDIETEIKREAAKGNCEFWHDGYVHRQAIKALKDLGYQLKECDSQFEGYSLQVKW